MVLKYAPDLESLFNEDEKCDSKVLDLVIKNRNKEHYLELFDIIKDNSAYIKNKKTEIKLDTNKLFFTQKNLAYNSAEGVALASFLYLLSENKGGIKLEEAVDFVFLCVKKSGLNTNGFKCERWVKNQFVKKRSFLKIDEGKAYLTRPVSIAGKHEIAEKSLESFFDKSEENELKTVKSVVKNRRKEDYLQLFEIIKEKTKDIQGKEIKIKFGRQFDDKFLFLTNQYKSYNSAESLTLVSFLYLLSKDHYSGNSTSAERAVSFVLSCIKDSGLEFEKNKVKNWVENQIKLKRSYIQNATLIRPITCEILTKRYCGRLTEL